MNNLEISDEQLGEGLRDELKEKKDKELYQYKVRMGDDLDWYISNGTILEIVFEYIRADEGNPNFSDADCFAELKRLCEPSVRHYIDCVCPICR